ncbi:MAG: DUF87 domain-containing protein [Flavobacteriales bacterium]|nr:DUF87 domain-containing protein [Flavobacteriales bacterium]
MAFGVWFPPIDEKGFWFYSALFGLILGSRLDTPHFVKPADAVLYALPAVFGLFLVRDWDAWSQVERTAFDIALAYCAIIVIAGGIAILTFDLKAQWTQRLSTATKEIAQALGTPRAVFSVLVVFAVISFHRHSATEVLLILLTWILVAAFAPIETGLMLFARIRALFSGVPLNFATGELAASQDPNVYLVRQADGQALLPRQVIAINDPVDGHRLGLVLNHVGRDHNQLARVIKLDTEPDKDTIAVLKSLPGSAAIVLDGDQSHRGALVAEAEAIVGITAKDSTLEKLFIETIPDSEIEEGRLVQTTIAGKSVIYQVIKGLLQDEPVKDKNTYGFARAQAQKIGRWDATKKRFELVKWLPNMNEPVKLLKATEPTPDPDAIGHFPKTDYCVSIKDINALVTHNTAILGILGVGKSMLSIELVERMMAAGIKVVCLDLTNQYAKELSDYYDAEGETARMAKLQEAATKDADQIKNNPQEGGSAQNLENAIHADLAEFMKPTNPAKLKIYNPSEFTATKQLQEPRSYQEGGAWQRSAGIWDVTPVEVTRMVTEAALSIVQDKMVDQARLCLVFEEAHSLVPEWNAAAAEGDRGATNGTARAILQGRKYGMGCLLITQRTANVTKTILNQCNTVFAMRSFDSTGMEFLSNYIGDDYAGTLSTLPERHAVFFGKASSCENPVLIRLNDQNKFRDAFRALHAPPPKVVPPAPLLPGAPSSSADDDDLPF